MASSQKKTGGSRTDSGGKRAASASSRSKTSSAKKQSQPAHRPFRREAGAVVCLLLAVFAAFGYFNMEALFIHFFSALLKGLLGYGFWLVPPVLVLGAYILAFHRGRPVRLRLTCALLLPLMLAALVHGLLAGSLPWDGSLVRTLWEDGQAMRSGGVLGGVLAQGCVALFSRLGCTIIFAMAGILLGLAAFNRTLVDVADWIFNRPRYEYEYEEPAPRRGRRERREEAPAAREELSQTASRRAVYDIPVEDGPLVGKEPAPPPEKKRHFFDRRPRVPSPDQLLTGGKGESGTGSVPAARPEPDPQPEFVQEPIVSPAPIPAVSPVTAPPPGQPLRPEPAPVRESVQEAPAAPASPAPQSAPQKVTRQEAEQAAAQVAQDIQGGLDQGTPALSVSSPLPAEGGNGGDRGRGPGRAQRQPPAAHRHHPLLRHRRQHCERHPRPHRHPV